VIQIGKVDVVAQIHSLYIQVALYSFFKKVRPSPKKYQTQIPKFQITLTMPSSNQNTGPVSEQPFRIIYEGIHSISEGIRAISHGTLVQGVLSVFGGVLTVFAGILLNACLFSVSHCVSFIYNIVSFFYDIFNIVCALTIWATTVWKRPSDSRPTQTPQIRATLGIKV
jgi:hypothetical protein